MNKDNKCSHCLHCDIVGHCSLGVYPFVKPEHINGCDKIEVGTHEQLNGRNMFYTGDLKDEVCNNN